MYGARHKDINEVMQSRSGAVLLPFRFILDSGGVVYGVCYSSQFKSYINVRIIKSNAMNFEVANMCRVI